MEYVSKNIFVRFVAIFLAFLFVASFLQSQGTNPGSEFALFLRAFNNSSDSLVTNVGSVNFPKNNLSQDSTEDTYTFPWVARKVLVFNDGAVPLFIRCDGTVTSGTNEIIIPSKISLEYPYNCTVLHSITGAGGATTFHMVAWR